MAESNAVIPVIK